LFYGVECTLGDAGIFILWRSTGAAAFNALQTGVYLDWSVFSEFLEGGSELSQIPMMPVNLSRSFPAPVSDEVR